MAYKRKKHRERIDIRLRPNKGVIKASPGDRAIGSMYRIYLPGAERTVFHDLAGDIFASLRMWNPVLVDERNLPPERLVTRSLVNHMMAQDYFLNARVNTALCSPVAYETTRAVWDTLMNDRVVLKALEMAQEAEDNIENARQQLENKQKSRRNQQRNKNKSDGDDQNEGEGDTGQGEDRQGDQDGDSDDDQSNDQGDKQEKKSKEQQAYDDAVKQAKALADRVQKSGTLDKAMGEAMKEASDEAEKISSSLSSWGFNRGQMNTMSPETAMKLADQSNSFIQEIAEAIGRVSGVASRALEQVREGYVGPPTQVANTQDFSRIFPTERMYLSQQAPPIMRAMKVSQYTRQGLLGWKPSSEGKKRGPFVAYVDESGSMDGDKHTVATAIAYGLARVLMSDNQRQQAFRIRSFGAENQITDYISNESTPDEIIKWVSDFLNSGSTGFNTPLRTAISDINELKHFGVVGADVLMITDGQVDVSDDVIEEFNRMRAEHGVRLFYICIYGGYKRSGEDPRLSQMCDYDIGVSASEFINNPESLVINIVQNMYRKEQSR